MIAAFAADTKRQASNDFATTVGVSRETSLTSPTAQDVLYLCPNRSEMLTLQTLILPYCLAMDKSQLMSRVTSGLDRNHLTQALKRAFPMPDSGRFDDLLRTIEAGSLSR